MKTVFVRLVVTLILLLLANVTSLGLSHSWAADESSTSLTPSLSDEVIPQAMGPAPSWRLNQGVAGICSSTSGFFLPGVEINVPDEPASEKGVLSAPGYPNLGFTQDSSFTGVGTFSFYVFVSTPYSLPPNTPLTLRVTTYNGPNFTGGVAYVSTITWDCTTGELISRKVPTLNEWGMIIMSLLMAGSAIWMIRRRQIA
ncbi:MAG: IPTL-CTERM sorting domain-containing protein [Desulfobacterales bacterium]|jgi:hypothetical protein|nr:IPTL-CTERM sorting domain-containing protein [Desulfobacterales bacterium]